MPNSNRKLLIMLYLVWWASLAARTVKNLLAVQETWVRSLGQEDPLEKGMAIKLQYSCLENSVDIPWGCKELDTTEQLSLIW